MDRIDALRASDKGERSDPSDETVINGVPYDPGKAKGGAAAVAAGRTQRTSADLGDCFGDVLRQDFSEATGRCYGTRRDSASI